MLGTCRAEAWSLPSPWWDIPGRPWSLWLAFVPPPCSSNPCHASVTALATAPPGCLSASFHPAYRTILPLCHNLSVQVTSGISGLEMFYMPIKSLSDWVEPFLRVSPSLYFSIPLCVNLLLASIQCLLAVHRVISPYICLSTHLSVYLFIYISIHLPTHPSICPSIYQSTCPSTLPFVHSPIYIYPAICLPISPFIHPSIHPPIQ